MPDDRPSGPSTLIQPPRLRTDEDRSASRLELFFDLAYILVLSELTGAFTKDLTWRGAGVFAGLFAVMWWSWVTTTLYANRFDTNDVPYRLAKLAQTFAVVVMAAAAATATTSGSMYFAAGYLATRAILVMLYARAFRHVEEARRTLTLYLGGALAGATLWGVSLAVDGPARYVLWAVGVLVEGVVPVFVTRAGGDVPLHEEHLPERFGLFAMLVLGESVTSIVLGLHDTHFQQDSFLTAGVGFVITAALWWIYFDLGGATSRQRLLDDDTRSTSTHDRYVYGHLPLFLGLACVGTGLEEYILHPGELSAAGRWILCAGVALFVGGIVLIMAGTAGRWSAAWPWPAVALPVIIAIGAMGTLTPMSAAIAIAVVLTATVLVGIRRQRHGDIAASTEA